MKGLLKSKLALTLITMVLLAGAIVILVSGSLIPSHAANSTPIPFNPGIQGTFYPNPLNSGMVDFTSATPGAFVQNLPSFINFNPPNSPCAPNGEFTRPFTDVSLNPNGSCTATIAQGNGQQAGVIGTSLENFEAKFVATIDLPSPGQLTTTITSDDGWIFCMEGNNFQGPQPTPAPGNIMTNPPPSHSCPGLGLPEMADNNVKSPPTQFTVTTNIPVAGHYGIELDYTECCQGSLTFVVNNSFTSTPTPSPTPTTTPTSTSLLAPFNKGVTFTITNPFHNLGGYHNHPERGCKIGTVPDHCHNQLFGLDLVPDQQSDTTVLAPVAGTVDFLPSDKGAFGCMGIILEDGIHLNICHFGSWNVVRGQFVQQGKILGTRNTLHVHLSLDDRRGGKPYIPIPFNGSHTLEGMSLNPNHDGNGQTVIYAGQTFIVDVNEWDGTRGTSSNVAVP